MEDFERLLKKAAEYNIEVAMDLAFQCSPDHPYVTEHKGWFRWRPDGKVQHAENPPKKYEDILPINFETEEWSELWNELKSVVLFWIEKGVRIFRVDNPHTKPYMFWEWLIVETKMEMACLLGRRTAEMHLALSSGTRNPNFAPEPFSMLYQKSVYQSMQSLTKRVFQLLRKSIKTIPEDSRKEAEEVLHLEKKIIDQFRVLLQMKITATKIRIHGDYHLGQVLFTGKDFIIIDFEGEPARALNERRLKRSPLRDIAGMIRSFQYAAYTTLLNDVSVRKEDVSVLKPWMDLWYIYTGGAFLRSYLDTVGDAPFIPKDKSELELLLKVYLLEKAVYELGYELNNRPDWITIPVKGIKHLLTG